MNVKAIPEDAVDYLEYRDGELYWKISRGTVKAGSIAGTTNKLGYRRVKINGEVYSAHRVIWFIVKGVQPPEHLDHINRNPRDNRISNLRGATRAQNYRNNSGYSNNTSGKTGVYWLRNRSKWAARVKVDGRYKHLGVYNSFEDAVSARCLAEDKHYGEFAPT